jgi:cytochrome c oxidase cbb3-type subunit 3
MSSDDHNSKEIDELSGTQTTGHEWDGIKELDTPLPRWWVWTFYATIVFSIGYVIYYPAIPLIETSTAGISGVTARGELEKTMAAVGARQAEKLEQLKNTPLEEVAQKEDLYRYAVAGGESLFKVYCSQCHGSGAQGAAGYPNLNDDDWIWGGSVEAIYTTIAHGVRNEDDEEARVSEMPAFGRDQILEKPAVRSIAAYVRKLSGQDHDAALAEQGATPYAENCAACHGEDGKGNRDLGAPNLADAIWLYGGSRDEIITQINAPRHGVMPPWLKRLGEARVKQLALYVHSLGGGEKTKTASD